MMYQDVLYQVVFVYNIQLHTYICKINILNIYKSISIDLLSCDYVAVKCV